jgi:hypothetical protein
MITTKSKGGTTTKKSSSTKAKLGVNLNAMPGLKTSTGIEAFDESISDSAIYEQYSDAVLRSFPFQELLGKIRELLAGVGIVRLFAFFDDFSELFWVDQKLFVDVVLAPLNNASDETIRLKVAGYPGKPTTARSILARSIWSGLISISCTRHRRFRQARLRQSASRSVC